jgi:hypothetical protein
VAGDRGAGTFDPLADVWAIGACAAAATALLLWAAAVNAAIEAGDRDT